MLPFGFGATILGMRYVATALALFVVATAAAAQQWSGTPSVEPQPISLRPTALPAETKATLLELKRPPTLAPSGTTVAAEPPPKPAKKTRPRPPVTQAPPAPRRPALGAAPAPTPAPVPIRADDDDDDSGDDDGGD